MNCLTVTDVRVDADAIREQAHIEPDSEDAEAFAELVRLALRVGRPKAAYAEAYVEARDDDRVRIGGVEFRSRTLALNLESADRVFPFVATCGTELDEAFSSDDDPLQEYWWDLLKAVFLQHAHERLRETLAKTYRLEKTASMHPGSGDATIWPIEEQKPLFQLLGDVNAAIGVTLTESCLMLPNKSVSGIVFPTAKDFRSCQVCRREVCPNRRAVFDPALWAEAHR